MLCRGSAPLNGPFERSSLSLSIVVGVSAQLAVKVYFVVLYISIN